MSLKFISWNIDSLNSALTGVSARAVLSRKVLNSIKEKNPEVIALQETKLPSGGPTKKQLEILNDMFPEYEIVWNSSVEPARKGYAGTMFLYKDSLKPRVSFPKIGAPDTMDFEGRIITLEFDDFYLTQVYTPNAGAKLRRLAERQIWDIKYADYLENLDKEKYVIATGDFNVAHKEIDLANPNSCLLYTSPFITRLFFFFVFRYVQINTCFFRIIRIYWEIFQFIISIDVKHI